MTSGTNLVKTDLQAYLFSLRDARTEYQAKRAAARKTKRTPSELRKKPKANPQRAPRDRYDTNTFQQSVRKACRKAGVPVWTVLEVRQLIGDQSLEAALADARGILLRHADLRDTNSPRGSNRPDGPGVSVRGPEQRQRRRAACGSGRAG